MNEQLNFLFSGQDVIKSKVTVSVIDDDQSVRRALKRLLKSVGYDVKVFESAQAYLDFKETDTEGLIILDIQMPDIDGFELMKILTATGNRSLVIFITAHENPRVREMAMNSGAVAFLQKPFDDQSLLDAIIKGISGFHAGNGQNRPQVN